jgi:hypothetical protein
MPVEHLRKSGGSLAVIREQIGCPYCWKPFEPGQATVELSGAGVRVKLHDKCFGPAARKVAREAKAKSRRPR